MLLAFCGDFVLLSDEDRLARALPCHGALPALYQNLTARESFAVRFWLCG